MAGKKVKKTSGNKLKNYLADSYQEGGNVPMYEQRMENIYPFEGTGLDLPGPSLVPNYDAQGRLQGSTYMDKRTPSYGTILELMLENIKKYKP